MRKMRQRERSQVTHCRFQGTKWQYYFYFRRKEQDRIYPIKRERRLKCLSCSGSPARKGGKAISSGQDGSGEPQWNDPV